jgi:hypothetical protein
MAFQISGVIRSLEAHRTSDLADYLERRLRIATIGKFLVSHVEDRQSNDRREDCAHNDPSLNGRAQQRM